MNKFSRSVNLIVCHCLLSALFFVVSVQAEDSQRRVQIESDSFDFDQADGVSVYEGNVLVRMGKTSLSGDRVEVFSKQDVIEKILATSGPSKLETITNKGETLTARAQNIEINLDQDVIYFRGEVRIENKSSKLSGEGFVYNLGNDTFKSLEGTGRVRLELKGAERRPRKKTAGKAAQNPQKTRSGKVPLIRIRNRDGQTFKSEVLRKVVRRTTVQHSMEPVGKVGEQP